MTSASEIRSPLSSTSISADIRSSLGSAFRSASRLEKYSPISVKAAVDALRSSKEGAASSEATPAVTRGLKYSQSERGTPTSSPMTFTGRNPRISMASPSPTSARLSRQSSLSSLILARIDSTRFGVNARLTSPRKRVWSGGLRKSIDGEESPLLALICSLYARTSSDSCLGKAVPPGPSRVSLPSRLSLNTILQSSYLERKIAPDELLKTGDSSLSFLYQTAGLAIPSSVRKRFRRYSSPLLVPSFELLCDIVTPLSQ